VREAKDANKARGYIGRRPKEGASKPKSFGKILALGRTSDTGIDMERRDYTLYCEKCDCTWHVIGLIDRGYSDFMTVACRRCQDPLQEIRADWGYEVIGVRSGDFGGAVSQAVILGKGWKNPSSKPRAKSLR